jgi:tape measure domain-containing protein
MQKDFGGVQRSVDGLTSGIKNFAAGILAGGGMVLAAKQVANLNDNFVRYNTALKAVSGSQQEVAKNNMFITQTAARAGVSLDSVRSSFTSLAAATKGTAIEGENTRRIFEAITASAKALGIGGEQLNRAFVAISQMASKGVISMEELRGQLGEALPGALQTMAAALGMTVPKLIEFVESGKALVSDVFPKWADYMLKVNASTATGATNFGTFAQAITGVKNELQLFFETMTAGDLKSVSTGGDWKAIVAGWLDLTNMLKNYLAAKREEIEYSKSAFGLRDKEILKLRELQAEHDKLVRSYLTTRSEMKAADDALAAQTAKVHLLQQAIAEAAVSLDEFGGAQDRATESLKRAAEQASALSGFQQSLGVGEGAGATVAEQVFGIKSEFLEKYDKSK